jgi:hypothetical protein
MALPQLSANSTAGLIRLEAKFELLERMASPSRRALPEKSEK